MSQPTAPRRQLRLTRRGRLVRSALVLVLAVLLILALVAIVRAFAGDDSEQAPATAASSPAPSVGGGSEPSDGGGGETTDSNEGPLPSPTPEAEGEVDDAAEGGEIVRTDTVGEGTWTVAAPAAAPTEPEAESAVRTYAVRSEDGIGVDADEVAAEIATVLADARGWQDLEGVAFQQVATTEEAEFTISVSSPPTVDEMCLPARTGGVWSCRIGPDVVLNSDRWLHATPTYDNLPEYRAYMINHEVGHFLGHGHADCGAEGELAPVMLQQSIDLQGCLPNAWPADEPGR